MATNTPQTPGGPFPAPPDVSMNTPATGATRLAGSMAIQASRLAALRESMGTMSGLGTELQRAMARAAETQSLPTLREFDAEYEVASEMVKCICTPLPGCRPSCLLPTGADMADADKGLTAFIDHWVTLFTNEQGFWEQQYLSYFPEGRASFSQMRDADAPSLQYAVWIAGGKELEFQQSAEAQKFSTVIVSGENNEKPNVCVKVDAKRGRTNVPPGAVIQILHAQSAKRFGVAFDKKNYQGKRLYTTFVTEAERSAIRAAGGFTIFGSEKLSLDDYEPKPQFEEFYMHADRITGEGSAVRDLRPQIAGIIKTFDSRVTITKVPASLVFMGITIWMVRYESNMVAYDAVFDLMEARAFQAFNPRKGPAGGSYAVKVAGSLDEMQSLLRIKMLKPPVVIDEDEEDEGPLQLAPTGTVALSPAMLTQAAATPATAPMPPAL